MKLHLDQKIFTDYITDISYKSGIREVYLEKDYWVTYVLKNLSKSKFVSNVVFKGGTSLSKAHKVIERFSEDVDLALLLKGDETGGQIKNLIKKVESTLMNNPFIVNQSHVLTSKGSKFRKTAHSYPHKVEGSNFGQASEYLILEINSFANPTPCRKMKISSMISDFLNEVDQELVEKYDLHEFEIYVLCIERTFAEKVMGLVRASYSQTPMDELKEKIRHIYDLHMLMGVDEIKSFLDSDFSKLINKVREDDNKNVEFQGDWMNKPLAQAILFDNPKEVMAKLKNSYMNDFTSLVYGDLPDISEIIFSLEGIRKRLASIN